MYKAKDRYKNVEIAESYDGDRFNSRIGRFVHTVDMRALGVAIKNYPANSFFLDIPCGTGRLTEYLAKAGFTVMGVDISQEMLDVARKRDYGDRLVDLVHADAENLPFDADHFDYLSSGRLMVHIPPDTRIRVLKEFARVTKNEIIVGFHTKNVLADASRAIYKSPAPGFQTFRVSMKGIEKEIMDAGLSIAKRISVFPILYDYHYFALQKGR